MTTKIQRFGLQGFKVQTVDDEHREANRKQVSEERAKQKKQFTADRQAKQQANLQSNAEWEDRPGPTAQLQQQEIVDQDDWVVEQCDRPGCTELVAPYRKQCAMHVDYTIYWVGGQQYSPGAW